MLIYFCKAFTMTESVYNFIKQFTLNNETYKNLFLLHVQTVCSEKDFKEKTQKILK